MRASISFFWKKHYEKILISTDQALVSGSNFLIGLLISKILGLEELGVYAFAWMVVMMCSSLQQNFISIPMVNNYINRKENDRSSYLLNLFIIQSAISFLFAVIIYVLLLLPLDISFFSNLSAYTYILPIFVFSYLMQDFTRRTFLLQGDLFKLIFSDFIVNWCQIGFLILYLTTSSLDLKRLLVFFSLTYGIGFLSGLSGYFKGNKSFQSIQHIVYQHWKTAKWLLATAVLQWFAGNYFIISAGTLLGTESAGIVRIAQSIVGIMNVFFIALEFYVPPKAVIIYNTHGKTHLVKYCLRLTMIGIILCLLFSLILMFSADTLLGFIYGYQYEQYNNVIIVFSIFYAIVFIGYPMRFALRAMNKMKDMFFAYLIATLFSLVTAEFIVKNYGIFGVIAGLALTQIIMQLWYIKAILFPASKEIKL